MSNTSYISVKSVLYDLSLTIEDRYWNEAKMNEWLHKGLRLIRSEQMMENKVEFLDVVEHKSLLPNDFKYLVIAAYLSSADYFASTQESFPELSLPSTSTLTYNLENAPNFLLRPLRLSTNPFHATICQVPYPVCQHCGHEFNISSDLILTTTLQEGTIMLQYLGYPVDEEGCALIPDNEELKEALLHYVLYRYWMAKYNMMEQGADQRMAHHLSMWNTLSKKASGNMNLPDIATLERLKNEFNRLVPRSNKYNSLFLTLGTPENVDF